MRSNGMRDVGHSRGQKSLETRTLRQQGVVHNRFSDMGKGAVLAEVLRLCQSRALTKPIFIQACNVLSGKHLTSKEQGQLRGAINSLGQQRDDFLPIAQERGLL